MEVVDNFTMRFNSIFRNEKTSLNEEWSRYSRDIIICIMDLILCKKVITVGSTKYCDINNINIHQQLSLCDVFKMVKEFVEMLNFEFYNFLYIKVSHHKDFLCLHIKHKNKF